jgi:hypothetical protein
LSAGASPPGLEAARAGSEKYWQRRRIVYLELVVDASGRAHARVLADHGPAGAADSLLQVVRGWRLTPKAVESPTVAAFALDRTESQAWGRPGVSLPPVVRAALAQDDFACWMAAWTTVDERFSASDFIARGPTPLRETPWAADLLRNPELETKERFGLLRTAPGGRWVLDPFQGIDVDANGRLANDVDTGFAVYDARTGERWFYDVGGTVWSIALAQWLGPERFLVAGRTEAPSPGGFDPVWAPFLREVRLDERVSIEYLGAPLPQRDMTDWVPAQERCWRRAYPLLPPQAP